MIHLFDNLLRQLLIEHIAALTSDAQVRFESPDAGWRNYVANLADMALNIYLVDLRENRKLRSNERVRSIDNGIVNEEPAPARLDCHYLISAWSPAIASPLVEPTPDEHLLLYQAVAVLMQHAPFNPSRVYPAGSAALNAWPAPFRNHDLPAVTVPVEGFNKLAEFWSGMGQGALWKPVIYLVVTLPIALLTEIAGPMVTTLITKHVISGRPETEEVWIQIGGHVLDTTNLLPNGDPSPIQGAWVILENATGDQLQLVHTNAFGRFTFRDLHPGNYRLRSRAEGFAEISRMIEAPSPTGEYNLQFP